MLLHIVRGLRSIVCSSVFFSLLLSFSLTEQVRGTLVHCWVLINKLPVIAGVLALIRLFLATGHYGDVRLTFTQRCMRTQEVARTQLQSPSGTCTFTE